MQVHTLLYLVRDDRRVSEALICLALSRRVAWYVWQKHAHCGEPCTCTVQSAAERCEPTANRRYYTYFLNKYINTLLNINILHIFCTSFFCNETEKNIPEFGPKVWNGSVFMGTEGPCLEAKENIRV